jgi:hypothetical protein
MFVLVNLLIAVFWGYMAFKHPEMEQSTLTVIYGACCLISLLQATTQRERTCRRYCA